MGFCYMRRMRLLPLFSMMVALVLLGCGPAKPKPDAGPDTSCGLDCAAQENYGLIINRCFEYSDDPLSKKSPPSLGVWVREVFELEGGIATIPVEYRQGGQIVQTDYFVIRDGDLVLMRRAPAAGSVTYKTDAAITGVKWLSLGTAAGENFSTKTTAFLSLGNQSVATDYRVTTAEATGGEKKTPLGTFDTAFKMLFGESPDHGSDPRRIFVPGTGFVVIASPFNLSGGTPTPHSLQRIRDIGTADAGTEPCSLGVP
jgi:hypothetical protein